MSDKTLIIHISCEVIIMGSIAYFFHSKTKQLTNQLEQTRQTIEMLQVEMQNLKKQVTQTEPNLGELKYLISSLEDVKRDARYLLNQRYQQPVQQPLVQQPPVQQQPVQQPPVQQQSDLEPVYFVSVEPKQRKKAKIEVIEDDEEIEDLDKELENELNELKN